MLTTALIQCHFDYASASWFSGLSQKNKSTFQVLGLQNVRGPGSSTFAFSAAKLWNALPDNIQSIDTPGSFRTAVYMFLVRNYEAYDANPFLYREHMFFNIFIVFCYVFLMYLFIYWITLYCTYNQCH